MTAANGKVLVTGASGLVGEPLVERLGPEVAIALSHRAAVAAVPAVQGDVAEPLLGLGAAEYRALAADVGVVVHCAAATRFDTAREDYFALNRGGTANVLAFAAEAGARVVHVSTAFVDAERKPAYGLIDPAGYIESKAAAEELVRASGLEWSIVRPSVVFEKPQDGLTSRRQGFHFFLQALIRESLPILPSEDNERLDFVAADLVAEVLAAMVAQPPPDDVSFVTAGDDAWTVEQIFAVARAIFAEDGLDVTPPRLVPREMVDRLLKPAFYDALPPRLVRRFEQIDAIATVLLTPRPFASSLTSLSRHYGRRFEIRPEETFRQTVAAFLATLSRRAVETA